jgi:hypothetical protein
LRCFSDEKNDIGLFFKTDAAKVRTMGGSYNHMKMWYMAMVAIFHHSYLPGAVQQQAFGQQGVAIPMKKKEVA